MPTLESVLFRTEVIKVFGVLDESMNPLADQDFMMRIAHHKKFFILKQPCAIFSIHEDAWGFNRDLYQVNSNFVALANRYMTYDDLPAAIKGRIDMQHKKRLKKQSVRSYSYKDCYSMIRQLRALPHTSIAREKGFHLNFIEQ